MHGNVYEFLRNTKFNARPFFFPKRQPNNQNQFGGNVGGQIMRDQTFFFGGLGKLPAAQRQRRRARGC